MRFCACLFALALLSMLALALWRHAEEEGSSWIAHESGEPTEPELAGRPPVPAAVPEAGRAPATAGSAPAASHAPDSWLIEVEVVDGEGRPLGAGTRVRARWPLVQGVSGSRWLVPGQSQVYPTDALGRCTVAVRSDVAWCGLELPDALTVSAFVEVARPAASTMGYPTSYAMLAARPRMHGLTVHVVEEQEPEHRPRPGVVVSVSWGSALDAPASESGVTDSQGTWTVAAPASGTCVVRATYSGGCHSSRLVTLGPAPQDVRIKTPAEQATFPLEVRLPGHATPAVLGRWSASGANGVVTGSDLYGEEDAVLRGTAALPADAVYAQLLVQPLGTSSHVLLHWPAMAEAPALLPLDWQEAFWGTPELVVGGRLVRARQLTFESTTPVRGARCTAACDLRSGEATLLLPLGDYAVSVDGVAATTLALTREQVARGVLRISLPQHSQIEVGLSETAAWLAGRSRVVLTALDGGHGGSEQSSPRRVIFAISEERLLQVVPFPAGTLVRVELIGPEGRVLDVVEQHELGSAGLRLGARVRMPTRLRLAIDNWRDLTRTQPDKVAFAWLRDAREFAPQLGEGGAGRLPFTREQLVESGRAAFEGVDVGEYGLALVFEHPSPLRIVLPTPGGGLPAGAFISDPVVVPAGVAGELQVERLFSPAPPR